MQMNLASRFWPNCRGVYNIMQCLEEGQQSPLQFKTHLAIHQDIGDPICPLSHPTQHYIAIDIMLVIS